LYTTTKKTGMIRFGHTSFAPGLLPREIAEMQKTLVPLAITLTQILEAEISLGNKIRGISINTDGMEVMLLKPFFDEYLITDLITTTTNDPHDLSRTYLAQRSSQSISAPLK
jgi:hypothetical protein